MKFSEVLKSVRNSHGDSLRKLSEKTGINFSYIDKVEKEIRPVNSEFLEKIIKEYPENKKELISAYCTEMIPDFVIEEIRKPARIDELLLVIKNSESLEELYNMLFKELENDEQKEILNIIIDRLEFLSYKKGTYEKNKEKIEEFKKILAEI